MSVEFDRELIVKLAYEAGFAMVEVRQNILKFEKFARLLEQHKKYHEQQDNG